jgi:hypothetical protein
MHRTVAGKVSCEPAENDGVDKKIRNSVELEVFAYSAA